MGVLSWIAVGIIMPIIGRLATRSVDWSGHKPGLGAGELGAILGGFFVDLVVRGDSVVHFNGLTLIGAIVGALITLGIGYGLAFHSASRHRPA